MGPIKGVRDQLIAGRDEVESGAMTNVTQLLEAAAAGDLNVRPLCGGALSR